MLLRKLSLKALGRVGHVQAVPQLADYLTTCQDPNEIIVLSGVLGLLGGSTARDALRGALLRVKKEPLLWSGVAYSLGRLGQMDDLREIVAAYLDRHKEASSDRDHRGLADIVGLRELAASLANIRVKWVKMQRELLDWSYFCWQDAATADFLTLFRWKQGDLSAAARKSIFILMLPGFLSVGLVLGFQAFAWAGALAALPVSFALGYLATRFASRYI